MSTWNELSAHRGATVASLLLTLVLAVTHSAAGWQQVAYAEDAPESCEEAIYPGIRYCTKGAIQILRINPRDPHVRFETVLPQGYDRDGNWDECRDVNVPQVSSGPGCHVDGKYPGELVGDMALRYPGAVVAFNADYFSFPDYAYGPRGLTIKNGQRLDGYGGDYDRNEVRRSSLSISRNGRVRIGLVDRRSLPDPRAPWTWRPDPLTYFNTVGGMPLLVREGLRVHVGNQCREEGGNCPAPYARRGRTAVGKTASGELIVVVIPNTPEAGLTLGQLGDLMAAVGAVDAINLDGGGSSQLWYHGRYLVFSPRPVAEGLLVFYEENPMVNSACEATRAAGCPLILP